MIPVTTPVVALIVAIEGLAIAHTPPVTELDKVTASPTQAFNEPMKFGTVLLTVTGTIALHPVKAV
jgi:hypothetical protein